MANKKVLIVDDDSNICELLRLYLEKDGFETVIANDGEEAIVKFNLTEPDIILLDIGCAKLVNSAFEEIIYLFKRVKIRFFSVMCNHTDKCIAVKCSEKLGSFIAGTWKYDIYFFKTVVMYSGSK